MNTPRHSVSVAAVITNDRGQALLIQRRDNNRWEPPGGVLELEESSRGWPASGSPRGDRADG